MLPPLVTCITPCTRLLVLVPQLLLLLLLLLLITSQSESLQPSFPPCPSYLHHPLQARQIRFSLHMPIHPHT